MNRTIICYGDSNTYGHLPADGSRMPMPWPRVLGDLLPGFNIIEEGRCGRTTHKYESPDTPDQDGTYRFKELIAGGINADLLIIMLGTNDTLKGISLTTEETVESLRGYIKDWRAAFGGDKKILLVSPIHITDDFKKHDYFSVVYPGDAASKSRKFAPAYKKLADEEKVYFMDAAQYASASCVDGIHMEPETHKLLASAIYNKVRDIFDI